MRRECQVHEGYEVRTVGGCIVCEAIADEEGVPDDGERLAKAEDRLPDVGVVSGVLPSEAALGGMEEVQPGIRGRDSTEARAQRPGPYVKMNKTEGARYRELIALEDAGEIMRGSVLFEPLKLRLARLTTYSPDFLYVLPNGRIVLEEIKGWKGELAHREDGWVKFKVAAESFGHLFAFRLLIMRPKKDGGGWEIREMS